MCSRELYTTETPPGHALYATKRQQSRKDLHGRVSSAQASTRGYAFAGPEGFGRRMIAGGEAMVQVCGTAGDRRLLKTRFCHRIF